MHKVALRGNDFETWIEHMLWGIGDKNGMMDVKLPVLVYRRSMNMHTERDILDSTL